MRVIYVAGPFRGPSHWAIWQNINRAAALSLEAWKLGVAVVCPHMNTFCFQDAAPDHLWLEGDLAILKKCDAILMTPDWERSSGATAELKFAMEHRIQVLFNINELTLWLKANEAPCPL